MQESRTRRQSAIETESQQQEKNHLIQQKRAKQQEVELSRWLKEISNRAQNAHDSVNGGSRAASPSKRPLSPEKNKAPKKTQPHLNTESLKDRISGALQVVKQTRHEAQYASWLEKKRRESDRAETLRLVQQRRDEESVARKREKGEAAYKIWKAQKELEISRRQNEAALWKERHWKKAVIGSDGHLVGGLDDAEEDERILWSSSQKNVRPAWKGTLDSAAEVNVYENWFDQFEPKKTKNSSKSSAKIKSGISKKDKATIQSPPLMFTEYDRYIEHSPSFVKKYPLLVSRAALEMRDFENTKKHEARKALLIHKELGLRKKMGAKNFKASRTKLCNS